MEQRQAWLAAAFWPVSPKLASFPALQAPHPFCDFCEMADITIKQATHNGLPIENRIVTITKADCRVLVGPAALAPLPPLPWFRGLLHLGIALQRVWAHVCMGAGGGGERPRCKASRYQGSPWCSPHAPPLKATRESHRAPGCCERSCPRGTS